MANPEHLKILKQGVKVWNRWREENPNAQPDLHGADLANADLKGADLEVTNLCGTKLEQANLRRANLGGAQLAGANLTGVNFSRADLSMANLNAADLKRAHLWYANFGSAVLAGADLTMASMGLTWLNHIDLSRTSGLEAVLHKSPSSIGTDTLYLSKGMIPEVFLRGVGLPEDLIHFLPSLIARSAIESYSCFISYSHADKTFARRLYDRLQGQGVRCWLDEHDLKPGDRILDVVNDAIRLHDKTLLCCSEASLNSWWVKDEIEKALERERRESRDIIIPLNLDGFLLDGWESGQATTLRSHLAADFTGWESDNAKFEREFERVVRALRADEGAGL